MSQEKLVDYNAQITLIKAPTHKYPEHQDVFQLKYVPPVPINELQSGQVIVRNLYLSIDASMRIWISGVKTYIDPVKPGDLMKGAGVAEVIYSNSQKFKIGDKVLGLTRWQKYSVLKANELTKLPENYQRYYDFLGVLGISGLTAYFGLKKIGNLKAGQTVVVSAAAGAVGEIAIQLAKNAGCKVIGIVGSPQKCAYIQSIGADHSINYRKDNLREKLRQFCPRGVNVYFDNVGGQMLDELLMHITEQSRIIACGAISAYNQKIGDRYRIKNYPRIIIKKAIIQGFIYTDYAKEFKTAIAELAGLMQQGKLKGRVHLFQGLSSAPHGLKELLRGKNDGKVIVDLQNEGGKAKL